jgi:hypothetical protein
MSAIAISTFGSAAISAAFAALRTSARSGTPLAESLRTSAVPFNPVAPVTRIIARRLSGLARASMAVSRTAAFGEPMNELASMDKNDTMACWCCRVL